ncbi:hypothetical protein [Pseudomonas aeruginosa]|uniref:hypothetical protein n=1 Tax=Pseudomonas aeruginosa TaxID=287 RepID=UPI0012FE72FA|nr:hypothetical protein [Pseudomonas aeruginosa]
MAAVAATPAIPPLSEETLPLIVLGIEKSIVGMIFIGTPEARRQTEGYIQHQAGQESLKMDQKQKESRHRAQQDLH